MLYERLSIEWKAICTEFSAMSENRGRPLKAILYLVEILCVFQTEYLRISSIIPIHKKFNFKNETSLKHMVFQMNFFFFHSFFASFKLQNWRMGDSSHLHLALDTNKSWECS